MTLAPLLDFRPPANEIAHIPANIEAEQALLGILLYDNAAFERVEGLRGEHFHEGFHGRLFDVIAECCARNTLAEPILIAERFKDDPAFVELGKVRYLAELVDRAPPSLNIYGYAAEIRRTALRREIIRAGEAVLAEARRGDEDPIDQLHRAEKTFADIASTGPSRTAWATASTVVSRALDRARTAKGMPGLSTGLRELDDATGGLRGGQLVIVAGRPGMAKSTAALALAKATARQGRGALVYSMEMPEFDLGLRMACDVAHDPYAPMRFGRPDNPRYFDASRGDIDDHGWSRLDDARRETEGWPLEFDVRPGLTVPQMLAGARRRFRAWEREGIEPGCVILDHLTIAKPDQNRSGNKVAEVGDISRGLAEMAKTLDVPVIGLCQLSRDVEKRNGTDRRPGLADLRWSGEIEQDARLVMFLYRPEYYLKRPEDREDFEAEAIWRTRMQAVRNKLFWLIEKNNNGPTGEVETYCDVACSAIRDRLGMGA